MLFIVKTITRVTKPYKEAVNTFFVSLFVCLFVCVCSPTVEKIWLHLTKTLFRLPYSRAKRDTECGNYFLLCAKLLSVLHL